MVRKTRERKRRTAVTSPRRTSNAEIDEEDEQILQKAQVYLLFEAKHPMLWTVAGIRAEKNDDGSRRWIIAVNLRYPTGFEGYLGDLVYDGVKFTELTELELMRDRARQIAADPEGIRQWNELRASALPSRKS